MRDGLKVLLGIVIGAFAAVLLVMAFGGGGMGSMMGGGMGGGMLGMLFMLLFWVLALALLVGAVVWVVGGVSRPRGEHDRRR